MFTGFMDWLADPLDSENGSPSAMTLFLFVGLIVVCLAAWGLIFQHIRAAA